MDQILSKDQMIETMTRKRGEWEALLAKVPLERIETPGVEGQWSVKDVMAHIAHYERWLAAFLESVASGEEPVVSDLDNMEMHARNAAIYELNHAKTLEQVQNEAHAAYRRLIEAVRALEESDFLPGSRFAPYIRRLWGEDGLLVEVIGGDSFDHYADHIAPLRAWLAAQSIAA